MLILAGVSLNAIVGDNGIITNAQQANIKSNLVELEEWLQEKYVEYYDEYDENARKQEILARRMPDLFLKDGYRNYIIYEGKVYYLINKPSLPADLQKRLLGGDSTEYEKYTRLIDVYGVTDDLKVFYYDSDSNTTYGTLEPSNIDLTKTSANSINNDGNMKSAITNALAGLGVTIDDEYGVTLANAGTIKELTIDGNVTPISSLSGLSDVKNLKTLTLSNVTLTSLDGIQGAQGLYYLYLKNCQIGNYSKLSMCLDLQYLYLYLPPEMTEEIANGQVTKLGDGLKNASQLSKLNYLGICGVLNDFEASYKSAFIWDKDEDSRRRNAIKDTIKSQLSDISGLSKVNDTIKHNLKYLYLNNNSITSIQALDGYNAVSELLLSGNNLTNLNGLEGNNSITYLSAHYCNLDDISSLSNNTQLYWVSLQNNPNLTSLNGLENALDLYILSAHDCDLRANSSEETEDEVGEEELVEINALRDHKALCFLDLSNNLNLTNVLCLGTCTGLKYIYLSENNEMDGVQLAQALGDEGTHILKNCGGNYSFPSKYLQYFNDASSYDYSYASFGSLLTDSSDEINGLKGRTNITRLNLSGQSELSDEKLQEILKTMTGLKALSLNGVTNLKSLGFIGQNMITGLRELDIRNTTVTDLTVLNTYGTEMQILIINNTSIPLSSIQTLINTLYDNYKTMGGCTYSWTDIYSYHFRGIAA